MAATRAAQRLRDETIGLMVGLNGDLGVDHAEILAPEGAPAWVYSRQALWNAVERRENRSNSQLARDIGLALPVELSLHAQITLARDFANQICVSKGMVVDLTVNRSRPDNPYAHLLFATRPITAAGFGKKNLEWHSRKQLFVWRELWARVANEHLERAGSAARIDHRTLEGQGIERMPQDRIGSSILAMERSEHPRPRATSVRSSRQALR